MFCKNAISLWSSLSGEDVNPIGSGLQKAVELWARAQQTDWRQWQGSHFHLNQRSLFSSMSQWGMSLIPIPEWTRWWWWYHDVFVPSKTSYVGPLSTTMWHCRYHQYHFYWQQQMISANNSPENNIKTLNKLWVQTNYQKQRLNLDPVSVSPLRLWQKNPSRWFQANRTCRLTGKGRSSLQSSFTPILSRWPSSLSPKPKSN